MKVFTALFSFLICLPTFAQLGNSLKSNINSSFKLETPTISDNLSDSITEHLNEYDVKYYELNLNVSNQNTEISGNAVIYVQVETTLLDTFYIELIDTVHPGTTFMVVDSIWVNNILADYIHQDNLIRINISTPLPYGTYLYVKVFYHGDGNGPVSNGTEFNYPATVTGSEPFGSKYWFPCKQILTDKADSVRMILTTGSDCLAGSNGILTSVIQLPDNKTRYEWVSHYPIAYYLISFAVGEYTDYETYAPLTSGDSVLIQSYFFQNSPYLPTQLVAVEKTKENIQLFSDLFGVFPFKDEKYGYCVDSYPYGGMENQTMTTLGYLLIDTSMSYINQGWLGWTSAHELGHSWFGDNVTCGTWQDIWLNEGFATYTEYLAIYYNVSAEAAEQFIVFMQNVAKYFPSGSVYVPDEYAGDPNRIFSSLSYAKGADILHIIRYLVDNDSLFFQTLKNYESEYAGGTATGLDFKAVLDSTTGIDFTDFFDEWYFGVGYPIFNIYYYQQNDSLYINSVQTTSSSATSLFRIPVEIKLNYAGGDTIIKYFQNENNFSFSVPINHQINQIVFDPNHWLVANGYMHITSVAKGELLNNEFLLSQNFPNPFNPTTSIQYAVGSRQKVNIKVYDVLGNEVTTLVNEEKQAGSYTVQFDGSNLSSGIYFYRLKSGSFIATKKLILLK